MTVKPIHLALLGVLLCFARPFLSAQPTLRQFVGVNLTAEDDVDKARRFAHLCEFHAWADDISILFDTVRCPFETGNAQKLRWNPSYNQNRYIRYDQFYGALPQKVSVVTQGAAPSMLGGGFANDVKDGKPICRTGAPATSFNNINDHLKPLAYRQQTIWQSLFAARYGAAPTGGFPPNFTNITNNYIATPDNTGLGLGLVREMENFNEQDASWNDAFQITSVLKIEVQDLDENGKRTLIPPNDIVNIPNVGAFIKNLTITETPLYLKFNGKFDISDPVAQPVNNLQVSSLCCGAARLTWAITMPDPLHPPQNIPEVSPGTVVSRWFQVYYAKKSDLNNVAVFDLSRLTTVEERLPGHFRECVVTGLEAGVEYYFFVLPVRDVVVGNEAFVKGLLPVIPTTLEAGKHYVSGTVGAGCGTSCLLSVGSDFTATGPQASQAATSQAFGLGESDATKCANLVVTPEIPTTPVTPAMIVPTGGIAMDVNGPLSLTYTVVFSAPKLLQAIYFVHGTGGPAKVRIEIIEDCCDQWKFVRELDIQSYNNLYVLANGQLNFRRIEQIRFIISRYPGSNPGLPRIYFCGSPATEICPGSSTGQPGSLTGPAGLTVKDIDTRSATIAWTPGKDKDLLPIARYRLRYGVATDAQGNIVNPKEVYQNANGAETTVEQTLGGLTPSTLYYTDVDVDPTSKGCTATPASLRTTFTTKDIVKTERGHTNTPQPVPAQLSVQPNPASQTVIVRSSEVGYIRWTLTYSNGVHIRGGKVEPGADLILDVSMLAPGLYIVTFLGGQKPPAAKTFVVQR